MNAPGSPDAGFRQPAAVAALAALTLVPWSGAAAPGNHKSVYSLMGEKCPECGQTVSFEEGCILCHFCGFNKCG